MFKLIYSSQFKKDFKKLRKLPIEDLKNLFTVIYNLENNIALDIKYKDHNLGGNWVNYRECHIKPDLLLIYKIINSELQLVRVGSHSELF